MMDEKTRERLIARQANKERIQAGEFWVSGGDVSGSPFHASECGLCGPHLETSLPDGKYVVMTLDDFESMT